MSEEQTESEIIDQMLIACNRMLWRSRNVSSPDDLLGNEENLMVLDSLCMMIIALGESVKNLDKVTHGSLLSNYLEVPWKNIAKMRDVISHHYFDLNAEIVFDVCQNHLHTLKTTLEKMKGERG